MIYHQIEELIEGTNSTIQSEDVSKYTILTENPDDSDEIALRINQTIQVLNEHYETDESGRGSYRFDLSICYMLVEVVVMTKNRWLSLHNEGELLQNLTKQLYGIAKEDDPPVQYLSDQD